MAAVLTRPTPTRRDAPFHGQGRSERKGEAYSLSYVEPLRETRTKAGLRHVLACRGWRVRRRTFSTFC